MRASLTGTGHDFIAEARLEGLLERREPEESEFAEVLAKGLSKEPLTPRECAVLLRAEQPERIERILQTARELKRRVYGNRIVLFAPLYLGNLCVNDCSYCGFRRSNGEAVRRTLTPEETRRQVEALEDMGHKRLILVFGEHPRYNAQAIAEAVRLVYATRKGRGEIRRVNINAAPLSVEDYATVKAAGIGTYQIFQETYHRPTYQSVHPRNTRKHDYLWRLHGLSRAMEAGIDDVGIGALFGLYDWRYEVLGLVAHARFLTQAYGVGPHTISFPRLQPASGVTLDPARQVSDSDFRRLVAILRIAVPYTGLIMTCRESPEMRREMIGFGVSQIDAGTRLELGGYTEVSREAPQAREREQFQLGDVRALDEVARELMECGHIPSFCTACYRLGRTGEVFMEYAIPGFIERFCTPNALTTLSEYLADYASPETRAAGDRLIRGELAAIESPSARRKVEEKLRLIRHAGARDLFV